MPKKKGGRGGRNAGAAQGGQAQGATSAQQEYPPKPQGAVPPAPGTVPPAPRPAPERTAQAPPPGFVRQQTQQQPLDFPPLGQAQTQQPQAISYSERSGGAKKAEHPAAAQILTGPSEKSPSKMNVPIAPEVKKAKGQFSPEALSESLVKLTMKPRERTDAFKLPKRPGLGKVGRPIRLIANHFEVIIPQGSVFHYDVEIEQLKTLKPGETAAPDEAKTKARPQQVTGRRVPAMLSRNIINRVQAKFREFSKYVLAYDGNKNLYTRKPLPFNEAKHFLLEFKEDGCDRESRFKVSIKPVEKEGTNDCEVMLEPLNQFFNSRSSITEIPQEAITALDIILRSGPSNKMFPVRSSFFNIPKNPKDKTIITGGHEIWFGYYQSLRPGQWKPLIVINKSATTFYPAGPVLDFFVSYLRKRSPDDLVRLTPQEYSQLNKEMKTVQIVCKHLPYPRKYRVLKVLTQNATSKKFTEEKDGKKRTISVADYFRENYKPLRYPNLPLLQVGNPNKDICLPIEVCDLVLGQHYRRKLTNIQTSEMIRFTATTPADRFRTIQESIQGLSAMSQNILKEFGIQISTQPMKLEGRVLQPPAVLYHENKTIMPRDGAWDMSRNKFLIGCKVNKWAILSLAGQNYVRGDMVNKLAGMLCDFGGQMGMTIPKVAGLFNKEREIERFGVLKTLQEIKASVPNMDLLVIILGRNSDYKQIKTIADTKLGLMTQCLKDDSVVKKLNAQLIVNVLQKINAKMGGVNSSLNKVEKPQIFKSPVIIIGADVSHPGPGEKIMPSVAAAVGSLDSYPSRYACAVDVQRSNFELLHRVERIANLDKMVKKLLIAFYKNTNIKPQKIIFYRDGVSEGQFADVQENEIPLIRKACTDLQADYKPALTFIVVQKRHHTRFMPEYDRDGVGRCKNVPPGTMVDHDVTSPADFDFFLCSHTGIQGTSRPAHYTVIWDENNFTSDELHKLTYHLCHTYVRCTRSISIPAPVQYAHLAAFRASDHLQSTINSPSGSESSSTSTHDTPLPPEVVNSIVTKDGLGGMYYV